MLRKTLVVLLTFAVVALAQSQYLKWLPRPAGDWSALYDVSLNGAVAVGTINGSAVV